MQLTFRTLLFFNALFCLASCDSPESGEANAPTEPQFSGNPLFDGDWYADPEALVFNDTFWIFPTYSDDFERQVYMDAFSSPDLLNWTKHPRIVDTTIIDWARQAMWAPSAIEHRGKYYFFFGANDVQRPSRPSWDPDNDINHFGGIGVAVADHPGGPYHDYLGEPLVDTFYNDAQPIDQFVFRDTDSTLYLFYGGWSHCNLGKFNDDLTGFEPWEDTGELFREITPEGYVEGPFMFKRGDTYYFMWSEGGWGNDTYRAVYATAPAVTGPYTRRGTILSSDPDVATGAGHHSVVNVPGTDRWIIVYHRRPIPNEDRDHRVVCMDELKFDAEGLIEPVVMTFEGVAAAR